MKIFKVSWFDRSNQVVQTAVKNIEIHFKSMNNLHNEEQCLINKLQQSATDWARILNCCGILKLKHRGARVTTRLIRYIRHHRLIFDF